MARVLVIEPDTTPREAIRAVLAEQGGHTVQAVAGGQQAVEQLVTGLRPQVVLVSGTLGGFYSASCLLELAYRRMLRGHSWVVLSATTRTMLDRRLGRWCRLLGVPIVQLPCDNDALLDMVDLAARGLHIAHTDEHVADEHVAELY